MEKPGKPSRAVRGMVLAALVSCLVGGITFMCTEYLIPTFKDFERMILYSHFRYRASHRDYPNPLNRNIRLIAIDRETLDNDSIPLLFWSTNFVPVLRMLVENGASVTGFDHMQRIAADEAAEALLNDDFKKNMSASFPGGLKDREEIRQWIDRMAGQLPFTQKEMEMALLFRTKKIVIPTHLEHQTELVRSIPLLAFAAGENIEGVANLGSFNDQIYLYEYLTFDWVNAPGFLSPFLCGGITGICFTRDFTVARLPSFVSLLAEKFAGTLPGGSVPLDRDGRLWINYRRPLDPLIDRNVMFSYGEVLEKAKARDNDYFRTHFGGKLVLIGQTEETDDAYKTPFWGDRRWQSRLMPGIEIHAHALTTLLDKDYLTIADPAANCLMLLLLCLMSGLITYRFRPVPAVLLNMAVAAAFFLYAREIFRQQSIWIHFISAVCALPPVIIAVYLFKFATMERERERIRRIFGRYVSRNVMEALLSNPHILALGGERRRITILLSDINNFTPASERLTPEELMRSLNSYFNEMNAIILKYNGTIKQFVGDEIMVMYGAPMAQSDHAVRAVETALDMIDRLKAMKDADPTGSSGFYEVKIGIHTGEVVVGNVGSRDRTEYAAVGDNVNMTSRIEGLNKKLGTVVLISSDTYEEVKDRMSQVRFRAFDPQQVKGKKMPVTVYEVIRNAQRSE